MLTRYFIPWVSLTCMTGCLVAYFFAPPLLFLAAAVGILAITVVTFREHGRAVLIGACLIAALLGMIRVIYTERHRENTLTEEYTGTIIIRGVVTGNIEHKETHDRYVVRIAAIEKTAKDGTITTTPFTDSTAVLVYEPYPTACMIGEEVVFRTRLRKPRDFTTTTGRVFRYGQYLRQMNIHAIASVKEISCVGYAHTPNIFSALRGKFVRAMNAVLPSQEASLLGGLLLGLRGSLSDELMEAFRITGLIHIIVLSGYNVTLVAEAVRRVFSRTPEVIALSLSFITIIMFVLLSGAQTAAVRAGGMASVALIARASCREYDGIRTLLLIAALMVLYNPDQILFSASLHMSFLATLGLLIFSPAIERRLKCITDRFQIRSIVAVTLATQIYLLPYLAYAIGEVSVIGMLANILVLPLIPLAMAFGAFVSVIALFSPVAAIPLVPLAYLPLRAVTFLAETLAQIPHASMALPELHPILMISIIILLTWFGFKKCQCADMRGLKQDD